MNRRTALATRQLKDIFGSDFDPVMQMCGNAASIQTEVNEMWESDTRYLEEEADTERVKPKTITRHQMTLDAIEAWNKCAQYLVPKLKAVEIRQPSDPEQEKLGQLSDIEVRSRILSILAKGIERKKAAEAEVENNQ